MKSGIAAIVIFLLSSLSSFAGDGEYAVSKIPAELLKNASVVKRMETERFEITNDNKAKYYRKVAYTILNENGDQWGYFSEGYDKLISIESFDGWLYDANGKKLESEKR